MNITLKDLKKQLGPGLGLRKSKYLLEIPVPGLNGKKINILCRSTSLPERTIGTVEVFDKGRKYKMRAETVFPGTYNISILDDSTMTLRALFDNCDLVFLADIHKKAIAEEIGMSSNGVECMLSKLRKTGIIKDNRINKRFIPNLDLDAKSFNMIVVFDIQNG